MDLQLLADRLEITDLLTRYASSVDRKDWQSWRSCFTEDAYIDYRSAGGIDGDRETVARWLEETLAQFPMTQHLVSNIDIEVDGDRATARAMLFNPMGNPDGSTWFCGGYYNHELVRTPEGWRSRRLIEETTWFSGLGPPAT